MDILYVEGNSKMTDFCTSEGFFCDEIDRLFRRREREITRLKAKARENVDSHCTQSEIFQMLKGEMVEVMEQDIRLWQQLTTLQEAINSLKNELIVTRCRTNTFSPGTEPDQGLGEDGEIQNIPTKPRSHTITLAEETRVFPTHSFLLVESLNVSVTKEFRAVGKMRDTGVTFNEYNRRSGFLGTLSPFRYKTGLFANNLSGLNNNLFLTGLNVSFLDLVGDLIKAPSSQQILPRRRLHIQSNVYNLDHRDVETPEHNANSTADEHNLGLGSKLEKVVSVDANRTNEVQADKEQTTRTRETGLGSKYDIKDRSGSTDENVHEITERSNNGCFDNEVEYSNKDIVDEISDRDKPYHTDIPQDNEFEPELADMTYTYLILKDGYVTCRIMTPGLEQQIKLKHETEDEPLEYLRYSCGFVRFRSGSDSESSSWSESEQSDTESSSLDYFNNAKIHSDVYNDIKYLFRIDKVQEGSESDQSDIDSNCLVYIPDEETEPDVFNGIKYLFGVDRERYFSESDQSDADGESLDNLTDEELGFDAYHDIKYLYGTDGQQYCSESSKDNVEEGCEVCESTLPERIRDAQVMTKSSDEKSSNNFKTRDLQVHRDTINMEHTAERFGKHFVATDEILNQIVGDTRSVLSQEYIMDGCGLCVYTEKQCSFTYRISSVDSGIGDDANEFLELSD